MCWYGKHLSRGNTRRTTLNEETDSGHKCHHMTKLFWTDLTKVDFSLVNRKCFYSSSSDSHCLSINEYYCHYLTFLCFWPASQWMYFLQNVFSIIVNNLYLQSVLKVLFYYNNCFKFMSVYRSIFQNQKWITDMILTVYTVIFIETTQTISEIAVEWALDFTITLVSFSNKYSPTSIKLGCCGVV